MIKSCTKLSFLFVFLSLGLFAQSVVIDDSFFSVSLARTQKVDVYLPDGYNPNLPGGYPVIYFLHGFGEDQNGYPFITDVADNLISQNTIQPLIIVKPDGSTEPYIGSFYTNSELNGNFEDYIINDLISYIDSSYNSAPVPERRCIMGHSMGGYGSMKLILKHPQLFAAVASHSGPLDFKHFPDAIPVFMAENGGSGPFNPNAGYFSQLVFAMAGAFSPNLADPLWVDMVVDNQGGVIDSVFNLWLTHSPAELLRLSPDLNLPAYYFDCGRQDELFLFPHAESFADSMTAIGLPFRFEAFTGDHNNRTEERFYIALAFLDSVMQSRPTTVLPPNQIIPADVKLRQNFPNPFNPQTSINFEVNQNMRIKITVFNNNGQDVRKLLDRNVSAGEHQVIWNGKNKVGSNSPSGVYYIQLTSGTEIHTLKSLLLR